MDFVQVLFTYSKLSTYTCLQNYIIAYIIPKFKMKHLFKFTIRYKTHTSEQT